MNVYDRCVDRHFENRRRRSLRHNRLREGIEHLFIELRERNFSTMEDAFKRESEALDKHSENDVRAEIQ